MAEKRETELIAQARKKKAKASEYTGRPLPRNIRRALEAGDCVRTELCIAQAKDKGWTEDELNAAFDWYLLWVKAKNKVPQEAVMAEPEPTIN